MGKIIMCHGRTAQVPYIFELSKTPVYTIEEMSYYLYEHIYEIQEDLLNESLIQWVRNELSLDSLASKLETVQKGQKNLRDIVVTILCSNDYYTEKEIKEVIRIIDAIMDLNPLERKKMKGDYFLRYGMYRNAKVIYQSILVDQESNNLDRVTYGDVLHNLAITNVHIASSKEASLQFKEAYNLNHKKESLRQYLLTLRMLGEEEVFDKEIRQYQAEEDYVEQIINTVTNQEEEAKKTALYQFVAQMQEERNEGMSAVVREKMEHLLTEWKQEYRRGRQA